MKTLFNICVLYVSKNLSEFGLSVYDLPTKCKESLLECIACHDLLLNRASAKLLSNQFFISSLRQLNFYLSDELNDDLLWRIGSDNHRLQQVSIVFCPNITNRGIRGITQDQPNLVKLELKGLKFLSSYGIAGIASPELRIVDLSECPRICSSGVIHLVTHNKTINRLALNGCQGVDDIALYAIGAHLNSNLVSLELDFLINLVDPVKAITYLSNRCPNLVQLSLCRYFEQILVNDMQYLNQDCNISSGQLRELDLYGNFLSVLPRMSESVISLRLSCTGNEDVHVLTKCLQSLPNLSQIRIVLTNREINDTAVKAVNGFLEKLFIELGPKITGLQITFYQIKDRTFRKLLEHCCNLTNLAMDVIQLTSSLLMQLFSERDRTVLLKSLKLYHMKLPHRLLLTIARNCSGLEDLEVSFMDCIDDRFLKQLASNCPELKRVNFNGCRWVSDKGIMELAKSCPLKELRVRGTATTDNSVLILAQFCTETLEWIAHADAEGRPKFSECVLQKLRDCCTARVIC